MHILAMGLPIWGNRAHIDRYHSQRGHEIRFLAIEGDADYFFTATETATDVVERVGKEWPVDAFVCFCPELFPPPMAIENCPVTTVATVSDWNVYFPQVEYNLSRYDLVLSDALGAHTLPLKGAKAQFILRVRVYSTGSRA
jgi:hypothetical protein